MEKSIDNGKVLGDFLTDLLKAFNCLYHESLIAKLNSYGINFPALKLIHGYLSNRKQRTKIKSSFTWHEIIFGVPQGSIQGCLSFNVFIIDLFFIIEDFDIASYVNDSATYMSANNMDMVFRCLEKPRLSYLNGSVIV